ncbi:hypothetical protein [Spongiimicrobium salis]|uniref:hypothetical protein n=1 Tax=Spongiimicrobium salis TaxID=1667022 RepID=UPI00374DAC94
MKPYGLLLSVFFITPLVSAQQYEKLNNDSLGINNAWQERNLPTKNRFDKHLSRFPKQHGRTTTGINKTKSAFPNSMPIHYPSGNFKMRVVPIDTLQNSYLKVYPIK